MPAAQRHDLLRDLESRHDRLLEELAALNEKIEAALASNQAEREGAFAAVDAPK